MAELRRSAPGTEPRSQLLGGAGRAIEHQRRLQQPLRAEVRLLPPREPDGKQPALLIPPAAHRRGQVLAPLLAVGLGSGHPAIVPADRATEPQLDQELLVDRLTEVGPPDGDPGHVLAAAGVGVGPEAPGVEVGPLATPISNPLFLLDRVALDQAGGLELQRCAEETLLSRSGHLGGVDHQGGDPLRGAGMAEEEPLVAAEPHTCFSGAARRPFGAVKTASCGGGTGHPRSGSAGRNPLEHARFAGSWGDETPPYRPFTVHMEHFLAADLAHTPRSDPAPPRGPAPPLRPALGRSGSPHWAGLGREDPAGPSGIASSGAPGLPEPASTSDNQALPGT